MPSDDLNARWGRRLTAARKALNLSIRELARRSEIHTSHLARFERGEAGLGDEARIRVAAEIGQQVHDLFPYPHITPETECPSAEPATAEGTSRIPATAKGASSASSAAAPAAPAPEGSRSSE